MKEGIKYKHKSFGVIDISRFSSNGSQYFGSDLSHNGGISITISNAEKVKGLSSDFIHPEESLIRVELSNNQFVDAITSGMNTTGVPCTIKRYGGKSVEQINHVEDKKERFSNDMEETHTEYKNRIDDILKLLEGNIGKRKSNEIKHELKVLKNNISSNTNFVMTSFNESMEKTVTEAKHSISNYIDHKVYSRGVESLRNELQISIDDERKNT